MKRSGFLKSLATLLVAPSVISKVEVGKPIKLKSEILYEGSINYLRKHPLTEDECYNGSRIFYWYEDEKIIKGK